MWRLVTGWTVRGSNIGKGEIFRTRPDRPWVSPSCLYNGYWLISGGKATRAWRWPAPSLKKEYSCASTPLSLHGLLCFIFVYCFEFLFSVFCDFVLLLLLCCLFPIFVQVHWRLTPGRNPNALHKYHIIYRIISYRFISYHITSYRIVSYITDRIISYSIVSYHILSYHIISYRIISYISYHIITSYLIIYNVSYRIIYHIISYRIISYHIIYIISHHNISYLIIYNVSYRIIL